MTTYFVTALGHCGGTTPSAKTLKETFDAAAKLHNPTASLEICDEKNLLSKLECLSGDMKTPAVRATLQAVANTLKATVFVSTPEELQARQEQERTSGNGTDLWRQTLAAAGQRFILPNGEGKIAAAQQEKQQPPPQSEPPPRGSRPPCKPLPAQPATAAKTSLRGKPLPNDWKGRILWKRTP